MNITDPKIDDDEDDDVFAPDTDAPGTSAGIPVKRRSQSMSALKEDPRSPRKMGGIIVSFGEILSLSNRTLNFKILVNNNNNK